MPKYFSIIFSFILFFSISSGVSAYTLKQSNFGSTYNGVATWAAQNLGSGLSGRAIGGELYLEMGGVTDFTGRKLFIMLVKSEFSGSASSTAEFSTDINGGNIGGTIVVASSTVTIVTEDPDIYPFSFDWWRPGEEFLDENYQYALSVMGATSSVQMLPLGSNNSDSYLNYSAYDHFRDSSNADYDDRCEVEPDCGDVRDLYFSISFDETFGSSTTRFITPYIPNNGVISGSTNVNFNVDYFYNDSANPYLNVVGIDLKDVTTGFQYAPIESPILASGGGEYDHNYILTAGHYHLWRPYMRSTSNQEDTIYGSWYSLDVVTPSASSTYFIDPITGEPINATSSSFFDFLNVPQLLQTRVPFAYIYQVGSLLLTLDDIQATSAPIFMLPLGMASTTLPGVSDIEFFSVDTITDLMPSSFVTLARLLMSAITIVGCAMLLFSETKRIFS